MAMCREQPDCTHTHMQGAASRQAAAAQHSTAPHNLTRQRMCSSTHAHLTQGLSCCRREPCTAVMSTYSPMTYSGP